MKSDRQYESSAKAALIGYIGIIVCLLYLGIKAQL
tara:strand:- start:421 stop:525 length:105 start_codon:yes stop_codon:yes gene_type:complete